MSVDLQIPTHEHAVRFSTSPYSQNFNRHVAGGPKVHGHDWLFRLYTMTAVLEFALCSPFFPLLLSSLVPTINTHSFASTSPA
jgi:hypothetical protein